MDHSHSSPSLFSATCMRSASDLSEPMASQATSETLLETFEIFGKRRMHCQARRPTCPTLKWQNFEVLRKRDKSKQTETKDMSRSLAKRNIETGSKLVDPGQPTIMPLELPEPLGPKLFIWGEPVLSTASQVLACMFFMRCDLKETGGE